MTKEVIRAQRKSIYVVLELTEMGLGMTCFASRIRAVNFAIKMSKVNADPDKFSEELLHGSKTKVGDKMIYKRKYQ